MFSSFENIKQISEYGFVTEECPFTKAISEYIKRLGTMNSVHDEAKDHYNRTIQPSAAHSGCMMHQTYRQEVAKRIKIGSKPLNYAQIASKAYAGNMVTPHESWKKFCWKKQEFLRPRDSWKCVKMHVFMLYIRTTKDR